MENSSFGRVITVLFQPTKVFTKLAEKPTWGVALIVLLLLGGISGYIVTQKMDWNDVVTHSVEARGVQLSSQQLERATAMQKRIGPYLGVGGALLGGTIAYLLIALLFWVGLKLAGSDISYQTSFSTTLHGVMPLAVEALISIPVLLSMRRVGWLETQRGILATNLAFLAPQGTSIPLLGLMKSVDLFAFWSLALLAIGFAITGKVSRKASISITVGLWVLWVLVKLGFAFLMHH